MINLVQGETTKVEVTVRDINDELVDLTGASAIFSYRGKDDDNATSFAGTIDASVISVIISPEYTSKMTGEYDCEMKVKDKNGNVDSVYRDKIFVAPSVIPNFDEVEL